MTKAQIVSSKLPSEVRPDEQIPWKITIETVGSGEDYIGGAMFKRPVKNGDNPVDAAVFIIVDKEGNPVKVPSGKKIGGTINISPLSAWMDTIPDTLEWSAVVGRLERTNEKKWNLYETDRKNHTLTVKTKPPTKAYLPLIAAGVAGAAGVTYLATR